MSEALPAQTPSVPGDSPLLLLRELVAIMLQHPWLLAFTVLPNAIGPALTPVQAWLAKEVIGRLTVPGASVQLTELVGLVPLALGIFLGLGLLTLWEKLANRMLDDRLLIALQRTWFARRPPGHAGEQVARVLKDCEQARKPLDLLQKELWVAAIGLPAVLLWQLSLGAHLLAALLASVVPPFMLALAFGGRIGATCHAWLLAVQGLGRAVAQGERQPMHDEQERFFRHRVRFELWRQISEAIARFGCWVGLAGVLLLSHLDLLRLIPEQVAAGDIAAFIVNLRLASTPLADLTKTYNKVRESWPAVHRVLRPRADDGAG